MAASHIETDPQKNARVLQALRAIREGRAILSQEIAATIQMRDGDGSQASHYALVVTRKGYVADGYADANAAAKAGFDELSSLLWKLSRQAGEGDETGVALDQCCAKFGV